MGVNNFCEHCSEFAFIYMCLNVSELTLKKVNITVGDSSHLNIPTGAWDLVGTAGTFIHLVTSSVKTKI